MKTKLLVLLMLIISVKSEAQIDTTGKGGVDIISAFKPKLKDPVKLKFQATELSFKNDKPAFDYKIPSRQLSYAFSPRPVQPLAFQTDSSIAFTNSGYVKLGYGNLRTPYAEAAVSLGNPNEAGLTVFAKNTSSASNIPFQEVANTSIRLNAFAKTTTQHRWDGYAEFTADKLYKYGFVPATLSLAKDSLLRKFKLLEAGVSLKPLKKSETGLSYSPAISFSLFSDNHSLNETQFSALLPFVKKVNDALEIKVGAEAELIHFAANGRKAVSNNIFKLPIGLAYTVKKLELEASVTPYIDNSEIEYLHNLSLAYELMESKLSLQFGWKKYLEINSFSKLIGLNPWIFYPSELKNTVFDEKYIRGFGKLSDHISYSAKLAFTSLKDQVLIHNDTASLSDGKSFYVRYQPEMNAVTISGELSYLVSDKINFTSGVQINSYSKLEAYAKAWGLLPLELHASLNWKIIDRLKFNSVLSTWSGAPYIKHSKETGTLGGAFDVGLGAEYSITKQWRVWAQANNLLNNKYQRWSQYPVYGTNFVGGIVFSFNKK
jgi:hypothetical protein